MSETTTVQVFRGCSKHALHRNMFFSSSEEFAETYGEVRAYEIELVRMFDSLDRDSIEPLLPLHDPYDDEEVATWEQYEARTGDTWDMIEAILPSLPGYDVLRITEGGVVNYLVRNPALVFLSPSPTP